MILFIGNQKNIKMGIQGMLRFAARPRAQADD